MGNLSPVPTTVQSAIAATLMIAGVAAVVSSSSPPPGAANPAATPPPPTLGETGLYADWTTKAIAPGILAFNPQYPLWTDGADKRRWIRLPAGTAIDGSRPDAWQFPIGTQLWKEFSFGHRTETRYMVRTAGGWSYATYVWTADESDAVLAPRVGTRAGEVAPGVAHAIPAEAECRACHANGSSPVLGFSALQLSPDRDPGALHRGPIDPEEVDLAALIDRGLLTGTPSLLRLRPPRIPGPPVQRAALGYLHGNCGGCHRAEGSLEPLGLILWQPVEFAAGAPGAVTTIDRASQFIPAGTDMRVRVAPGEPEHSVLLARMRERTPVAQMPPLGSQLVDEAATRLIASWIDQLAPTNHEGN
jgi:hypothetical protein